MGAIKDFRIQTTAPNTPASSTVGIYADASGYLIHKFSDGTIIQAGTLFTGQVLTASIATGQGKQTVTGFYYGPAGSAATVTGLATPHVWLPYKFDGKMYGVPAYLMN